MKIKKGEYGYLKKQKTRNLVICLFIILIILLLVIINYVIWNEKTIFLLFPILLSLPFSKFLSTLVVIIGLNPCTNEDNNIIKKLLYGCDKTNKEILTNIEVLYDLIIFSNYGVEFYQIIIIFNDKIIALKDCSNKNKINTNELNNIASNFKYNLVEFDEIEKFICFLVSEKKEEYYDIESKNQFIKTKIIEKYFLTI